MKFKFLLFVLGSCLFVTGCFSPGARIKAINNAAAPVIAIKQKNTENAVNHAKGLLPAAAVPTGNIRLDTWKMLQDQKDTLDTKFNVAFDENRHRANQIGAWKAGLGIAGISAGVASAALVVASPANAVWVSVLSGFAGGVAGFNGALDSNGYSREQILALEATVAQEYGRVSAGINLARLFTLANDPNTTPQEWIAEVTKQQDALNQLERLAIALNIPVGKP